jgi:hypothetical protein
MADGAAQVSVTQVQSLSVLSLHGPVYKPPHPNPNPSCVPHPPSSSHPQPSASLPLLASAARPSRPKRAGSVGELRREVGRHGLRERAAQHGNEGEEVPAHAEVEHEVDGIGVLEGGIERDDVAAGAAVRTRGAAPWAPAPLGLGPAGPPPAHAAAPGSTARRALW